MKKKFLMIAAVCLILLIGTTIYAQSQSDNESLFYNIGKLFMSQESNSIKSSRTNKEIYAKGKDILITKEEFDNYVLRAKAGRNDITDEEAQKEAYDYLCKNKTLLYEAEKLGFRVSEQEIDDEIKRMKSSIDEADNKEEAQDFIDGFGGENYYWDTIRKTTANSLVISKYLEQKKSEFLENNTNGEESFMKDDGLITNSWFEEKEKIIKELIEMQEIQILSS